MSGVATATILNAGTGMKPEYHLMSVDIIKTVNRIPSAQLILLDGSAPKQNFKISNTDFFAPGKEIEIKLEHEGKNDAATVFKGIVVKHGARADAGCSLLTVDLMDAAIKLTTKRKSRVFNGKEDGKIIKQLVEEGGLEEGSIEGAGDSYGEMVQYYCTDWDFILSRADANGQWVLANDGKMTVKTYSIEELARRNLKHTFVYGKDEILDFELEADIRDQYGKVQSLAWNSKEQAPATSREKKPLKLKQGNLIPDEMAGAIGSDACRLVHMAAMDANEQQAWTDAKMEKSLMSMLRGRVKTPGDGSVEPGDVMEIKGVGDRFNGKTYVTGVRHRVSEGGWVTDVQFGLSAEWFWRRHGDIMDSPASGLVPGVNGLQIGIVDAFEDDPEKQFRVKVKIPAIDHVENSVWARLASIDAGDKRGVFFRPEKGDEVVLGFFNDDPRQPVILGAMHSEKNAPPTGFDITGDNFKKGVLTKESLKIALDDEKKCIELSTPNGNILRISDADKGFYVEDENKNTMTLDDNGIKIFSKKEIVIEGNKITIKGNEVDVN